MKANHRLSTALLAVVSLLSCSREAYNEPVPAAGPEKYVEAVVSLTLRPDIADTKSSFYNDDIVSELHNVVVYGVDEATGEWKRVYVNAKHSTATTQMSFYTGHDLTFYALGNMGDVDLPTNPSGELAPEVFSYLIDEATDFNINGFPMAAKLTVSASEFSASSLDASGTLPLPLELERLVAKVVVNIDKTAITGGVDAPVLSSNLISIHQANRRMRPFHPNGSAALSPSDLFSGAYETFDVQLFTSDEGASQHADIVLYVPENRQGVLLNGATQEEKTWENLPSSVAQLCTYIEYTGGKVGDEDGVSGAMTYRAFLGSDETDDFTVWRNSVYTASLSLTWDGMWTGSWRVGGGSWSPTDRRKLVISSSSNSFVAMTTDVQRVKKSVASAFYVNYSVDDGATSSHGRMLQTSWPFGYEVLIDDTPLSAVSGTLTDAKLSWSYSSSDDCLSIQALPGAPSGVTHTLQMRTIDGRRASNIVNFTAEIPFTGSWASGAPIYVAQNGLLHCIDPDTGTISPEGVFHLTDPSMANRVRLTDNGDGTARVALLQAFSGEDVSVYMTDGDGNRRSDPVVISSALLPHFGCTDLVTTYVDASSSVQFVYYGCNNDDTRSDTQLKVISSLYAGYTGVGDQLDKDLVESLIAPTLSGADDKLGYTVSLQEDGTYLLDTYISSYNGVTVPLSTPAVNSFTVDLASVSFNGAPTATRPPHKTVFSAWNPWRECGAVQSGQVLDDYTLYQWPNWDKGGWSSSPQFVPDMSAEYSMYIGNPIIANTENITYDGRFKYGYDSTNEGYIGSICSGTPKKLAYDYDKSASKYTLEMHINWDRLNDKDCITVGNYLAAHRAPDTWFPILWEKYPVSSMLRAYLEKYNGVVAVSGNYSSESAAQSDVLSPSVTGVSFSVYENTGIRTWRMTYSLKGKTDVSMNSTHNAGPVELYMQVRNPHDQSVLRMQVATIYIRLHAYIYPMAISRQAEPYDEGYFVVGAKFLNGNSPFLRPQDTGTIISTHSFSVYDADNRADIQNGLPAYFPQVMQEGGSPLLCKAIYPERVRGQNPRRFLYNPNVSSSDLTDTRYEPLVFALSSYRQSGTGYYKRVTETLAYFDPWDDAKGPFHHPDEDYIEDSKLFVLHIIPFWYFSH